MYVNVFIYININEAKIMKIKRSEIMHLSTYNSLSDWHYILVVGLVNLVNLIFFSNNIIQLMGAIVL